MLLEVLKQSKTSSSQTGLLIFPVTDLFRVGDWQFIRPSILWNDNKTYLIGDQGSIGGHQYELIPMCFDHGYNTLSFLVATSGTDGPDPYDHPVGWIWLQDNRVYIGQSNPHNGPIDIFKANDPYIVTSGFTEITGVTAELNAYPKAFLTYDGIFGFNVRIGNGALDWDMCVQLSDSSSIEGTITATQITANTTSGYRFYNNTPVKYGTNTKDYLCATLRRDSSETYFAHVVMVTTDFQTFSNYQGTASKNVVSVAPFTNAEIEADYIINGSPAADTDQLRFMNCIQINDVFYGAAIKSGTSDFYIFKIDGTSLTDYLIDIPNLRTDTHLHTYLYYNGSNIILSVLCYDSVTYTKELWAVPLDIGSFTQKYVNDLELAYNDLIKLPENLDQVTGNYAIWVDNQLGVTDYMYLYVTNDKFLI